MRLPFNISDSKLEDNARVKFLYTSPELHQTIEISIDGEETSVETLVDAFQRFLGALGISIPPNVSLAFLEEDDEENSDDEGDEDDEGSRENDKRKKK